ncbi:hypothetical protein F5Y11DRAFT_344606 [Daldinia sp. FL1419]|nr:hypothetical protein F5Y11DRAFT_344606 [Daldinia sp. FL1419]
MDHVSHHTEGNLGPALLAVAWLVASISILVVALRFYVRIGITRRFGVDDGLIILTLLCLVGNAGFLTVAVSWGLGKHNDALTSDIERVHSIKWMYICEFFAIFGPLFGRISFALLLSSIIPPSRPTRIFLWALIGIHTVTDVATIIICLAQCQPFSGYWDKSIVSYCWPVTIQQSMAYIQGSLGSAVDLALAILPCSLFWNLNMHWKQKAYLSTVMGFGVFAMAASIAKTIELSTLSKPDASYHTAKLAICWTLECQLVLLSASIPVVRPLFKTPRPFSRSRSDNAKNPNNMNTFMMWKLAHSSKSRKSHGSFEPLQEPTVPSMPPRITSSGEEPKLFQPDECHMTPVGRNTLHDGQSGIRKDIEVSISYDSGSQQAFPQCYTPEQAWSSRM